MRAREDRPLWLAVFGLLAVLAALTWLQLPTAKANEHSFTLAIADLRGHALVLVDPAHPTDARTVALPGGPHELLLLPDGRIVASLEQAGTIAIVDPEAVAAGAASHDLEVVRIGGLPHGLALHEGSLLVTDRSRDVVRRFDLGSWTERESLATGAAPHVVGVLAGAPVVANAEDSTLQRGDGGSALAWSAPAFTEAFDVSPSGAILAAAGAGDGVVAWFDARGTRLGETRVGTRPVRVQFAPGSTAGFQDAALAVALSADGAVALLRGSDVAWRAYVGGVPDGIVFGPGGEVLFAGDLASGSVTALDAASGQPLARFVVGQSAGAMLVLDSPN